MLFHLPVPLDPTSKFGNDVRPLRMLAAFEAAGYQVTLVTGRERERAERMRQVRERVAAGEHFAFCYAESSVPPNTLLEPHHVPLRPFLDAGFFRFLKQQGIPCGVFYRDVYWRFEHAPGFKGAIRDAILTTFHVYDLLVYRAFVPRMFVPSLRMGAAIPVFPQRQMRALPPGHAVATEVPVVEPRQPLEILYVGGLSAMYDLRMMVKIIAETPGAHLTLCTREQDWAREGHAYQEFLGERVSVVHAGGDQLADLYAKADVASVHVAPNDYRKFAVGIKLFEYLGWHKPVLASSDTFMGEFVAEHRMGWSIPYTEAATREWLASAIANPSQIRACADRAAALAPDHTWLARAQSAARVLGQVDAR